MIRKSAYALAGAAMLFAAPAFAQNSATGTVTVNGNVISALTLGTITAVTMPTVVKPTSGTSSIALNCATATSVSTGVATYSSGANPFAAGVGSNTTIQAASKNNTTPAPGAQTGTCASVAVNGETGYFFLTTTGAGTTASTGVTSFTGNCTTASTAISGGTATIYCGASVSVDSTAGTSYTGTIPVTVTYD